MMKIVRTDSKHKDFVLLVSKLDSLLKILDGDDHSFYDQFNKLDHIKNVVLIYEDNQAIACGAFKAFDAESVEIKRMYTDDLHRGKGYATILLKELELWARELGYLNCILETGINQTEAIALYHKNNYQRIDNYGQYKGIENSYCFRKLLKEDE